MGKKRWQKAYALGVLLSLLLGCTTQATYMRRWEPVPEVSNRWAGGTLKESKLSSDEAAVYQELGNPDIIRFFRAAETRQPVYEWIYTEQEQVVWFVDGQRVDYVAVDNDSSGLPKETRETLQRKFVAGGLLGGAIGGVAAGMLVLGNKLGLKD
ncbi:MAG TPA: hypothetical protein VIH59_03665 [Candidatus Tectomicrobia bacterium]